MPAATLTCPSDVLAEGGLAPSVPFAFGSLLVAVLLAKLCWELAVLSTDWPEPLSCAAPTTLAVAKLSLPEVIVDRNDIAPADVMLRPVVAVEWSLTKLIASEMPTPVFDDLVSPAAFVLTVFDRVEDATSAPPMVSSAPVPSVAAESLSAIEIAMPGVMPVAPAPPAVASVSMVCAPA